MGIDLIDPNEEIRRYILESGNAVAGGVGMDMGAYNDAQSKGPVGVPLEDLVLFANLEVLLPGRTVIVDNAASQVQDRKDIGFIVPKDENLSSRTAAERADKPYNIDDNYGQLGTSWTNIGGLEGFVQVDGGYQVDSTGSLVRSGNPNESFGITNIDIKLNASFEPQVFIEFVDIRGASLMEPGLRSPYAAFFHMPYPMFSLTIKGHYGKGINYKLHLLKFNSKFDAETGNFIINCEFIGFTFTYLADIPAIYADVGPELMSYYQQQKGANGESQHAWAQNQENATRPDKPYGGGGSMTIGTYIQNIENMSAKIEFFNKEETVQEYTDVSDSINKMKGIKKRWEALQDDVCRNMENNCDYDITSELYKIITNDLYVEDTNGVKTLPTADNGADVAQAKLLANKNKAYSKLLLKYRGYTSVDSPSDGTGGFLGYVEEVEEYILNSTASNYITMPPKTGIDLIWYGKVEDVDANQDGDYDDPEDSKDQQGVGIIDAVKYMADLDAEINKASAELKTLKKDKEDAERRIKLETLVMEPTLDNIFQMICNGVGAFNKVIKNVAISAEKQHDEDPNLQRMFQGTTRRGTDIKEDSENVYAFPLYYETKTDGTGVSRSEKTFPGWKTGGNTYGVPEFTTEPYFWPEIKLVEELITTIIRKRKEMNSTWAADDEVFGTDKVYMPACLMEIPIGTIGPYHNLTDVEKQIIPLLMLRAMLRISYTNRFPAKGEEENLPTWGCDGTAATNCSKIPNLAIRKGLLHNSSNSGNRDDEKLNDAMNLLGRVEAETIISNIIDTGNQRLRAIYEALTGQAGLTNEENSSVAGEAARNVAWTKFKEAGYVAEKTGEYWMIQMAGQNYSDPASNTDSFTLPKEDVYSFYGTVGNQSGVEITTPYGFYLPNVNQELTTAIHYSNCENMATSSECVDFYISSEGYYRVKSQLKPATVVDGEEIPGVEQSEEQKDFTKALIEYYDSHFMQGTNAVGENSPVTKLKFGPQGTVDYNYEHWTGWDFFSYYGRASADKQYNDENKVLMETDRDWMAPDQFMHHSIQYSSYDVGGGGTAGATGMMPPPGAVAAHQGLNSDRQTFILEDALWIKNDWQNSSLNSDYADNAPYSHGADAALSYNEALIEKPTLQSIGTEKGDPEKASDIALGYMYINSVGKKYTLNDKLQDDGKGADMSILDLFNGFGSNMVIPQYVVLQIGSILYRYDNPGDDIIRWPNYFDAVGNGSKFRIPKKNERMCPAAKFSDTYPTAGIAGHKKYGRRSGRANEYQWNTSADLSNQLHFFSGMDKWHKPEDVFYEKIPDALINLPDHIRVQFKERFVSWALGVHIGETGIKIAPTFPTLKKYATQTVDLPFEDTARDDFFTFCKDTEISAGDIAGNPNLSGLDTNATPYKSNFLASWCTGWVGNYNSNGCMEAYKKNTFCRASNLGICTRLQEGYLYSGGDPRYTGTQGQGHPPLGSKDARLMVATYATREIPDGWNAPDNERVRNLSPTHATFTLPLFLNASVNAGPQGQNISDWMYKNLFQNQGWLNQPVWGERMDVIEKYRGSTYTDEKSIVGYAWNTVNYHFTKAVSPIPASSTDPKWQPTGYHSSMWHYYYIRKASHTNKILSFNQPTKDISTSTPILINDSYGGFPDIGSSVYRWIQYSDPIKTQAGKFRAHRAMRTLTFEEDSSYARCMTDLWAKILWWDIDLGDGGNVLKPTFTVREYTIPPKYQEDSFNVPSEPNEYYKELRTLMRNRVTIKNPTWLSWLGVPEGTTPSTSVKTLWTDSRFLTRFYQGVTDKIHEVLSADGEREQSMQEIQRKDDIINDNDIKLDTYLTLKNIHDKWLTPGADTMKESAMGYASEDITWLYRQFQFVDRAYNDIRHKYIDPTPLLNLKKNPKISIYTLMYDLIAFNKFEFFPLPTGIEQSTRNFGDAFTPFLTIDKKYLTMFPKFYIMYMGGLSDTLDIDNQLTADRQFDFKNDGFDIGSPATQDPPDFYDKDFVFLVGQGVKYGDYVVDGTVKAVDNSAYPAGTIKPDTAGETFIVPPGNWECWGTNGSGTCTVKRATVKAFRVAFGQENQNFFKSLTLDQSEFKETQESLAIIDALVQDEASSKNPQLKGQNLLNVYQKRSYSCEVESFGIPQILPLQYFQLDHVPMFHGAYLITNVEHNVTQGEMSTRFKGVRVAQSVTPYISSFLTSVNDDTSGDYTGEGDVFDADSMTVINGQVQRMGLWVDGIWNKDNPAAEIKLMMDHGFTNLILELNHFPDWVCQGPTVGDNDYRCKDNDHAWMWAPYRQYTNKGTEDKPKWRVHPWTKRSDFSLDQLKTYAKTIWEVGGGAVKLTLMDNIAASYYGVEDQCGGTKDSYTKLDWEAQGISQPMTFAQLAKALNDHAGGNVIQAIEWDCEGKYRKTKGSGSSRSNYDSGPKLRYYPADHYDGGEKRDTIKAMLKKHRKELDDLGLKHVEMGVNWNAGTFDITDADDPNYYKSRSAPEFAPYVDYCAGQGYSHTAPAYGTKDIGRPNYGAKACSCATNGVGSCKEACGGSSQAFCDNPMRMPDEQYDGNGYCLDARYHIDGVYGPGIREAYNAATVKRFSDKDARGNGKPYLVGGLAGYRNKFPGYKIQTTLDMQWNGFSRPIPGNDNYGAVEIRWWSFNNLFGQRRQKRYKPFLDWIKAMKVKLSSDDDS